MLSHLGFGCSHFWSHVLTYFQCAAEYKFGSLLNHIFSFFIAFYAAFPEERMTTMTFWCEGYFAFYNNVITEMCRNSQAVIWVVKRK